MDYRQIAYLNVFHSPTLGNCPPTDAMYAAGWPDVAAQLRALRPRAVIAGGAKVGKVLDRHWKDRPADVVVRIQNRARSRPKTDSVALGDESRRLLNEQMQ